MVLGHLTFPAKPPGGLKPSQAGVSLARAGWPAPHSLVLYRIAGGSHSSGARPNGLLERTALTHLYAALVTIAFCVF